MYLHTTCSSLHHEEMIKTHLLPVVAVDYSPCFNQVLTGCEESVLQQYIIKYQLLLTYILY